MTTRNLSGAEVCGDENRKKAERLVSRLKKLPEIRPSDATLFPGRPGVVIGLDQKAFCADFFAAPRGDGGKFVVSSHAEHRWLQEDLENEHEVASSSGSMSAGTANTSSEYLTRLIAHPHPCQTSMARTMLLSPATQVQLPCDFELHLPGWVLTDRRLSDQQLETVALAAYLHETQPASQNGFLIGDQTGTGKGRKIAAIIAHHFRKNYKKRHQRGRRHLWISAQSQLAEDARRDFGDLLAAPAGLSSSSHQSSRADQQQTTIRVWNVDELAAEIARQKKGEIAGSDSDLSGVSTSSVNKAAQRLLSNASSLEPHIVAAPAGPTSIAPGCTDYSGLGVKFTFVGTFNDGTGPRTDRHTTAWSQYGGDVWNSVKMLDTCYLYCQGPPWPWWAEPPGSEHEYGVAPYAFFAVTSTSWCSCTDKLDKAIPSFYKTANTYGSELFWGDYVGGSSIWMKTYDGGCPYGGYGSRYNEIVRTGGPYVGNPPAEPLQRLDAYGCVAECHAQANCVGIETNGEFCKLVTSPIDEDAERAARPKANFVLCKLVEKVAPHDITLTTNAVASQVTPDSGTGDSRKSHGC
eukprot:g5567.t1